MRICSSLYLQTGPRALDIGCHGRRSTCDFKDDVGLPSLQACTDDASSLSRKQSCEGGLSSTPPYPKHYLCLAARAWRIGSLTRGTVFLYCSIRLSR